MSGPMLENSNFVTSSPACILKASSLSSEEQALLRAYFLMDLTIECEERKTALDEAQNNRLSCDENGILELNVGGQLFTTTRDTLSAAGQSFFSGLISGSFGILRDSKGCVFIDRDREFKGTTTLLQQT